jgi:hypothetical protein
MEKILCRVDKSSIVSYLAGEVTQLFYIINQYF